MSWAKGYTISCDGPNCDKRFSGSEQECVEFKRINKWYYHKHHSDLSFCSQLCLTRWVDDSFSNNYSGVSS